jgi:poly-D-alanine transfer protein DltD
VNILNKQPWANDKEWSSSLGVVHGDNNPFTIKNKFVTKNQTDKRPKLRNMDTRSNYKM